MSVVTESYDYQEGAVTLEGEVAYDSSKSHQRPVVIVIHAWLGRGDFETGKIQQFAQKG